MIKNLLSIFVVLAGLSILTLSIISIIGVTESYSQTAQTQAKSQSSNTIHITKMRQILMYYLQGPPKSGHSILHIL